MRVYKVKNYDEMSRKAANLIAAQIITKPDSVLGLATGSTPVGTYKYLVEKYNNGDLDFLRLKRQISMNTRDLQGKASRATTILCTVTFFST